MKKSILFFIAFLLMPLFFISCADGLKYSASQIENAFDDDDDDCSETNSGNQNSAEDIFAGTTWLYDNGNSVSNIKLVFNSGSSKRCDYYTGNIKTFQFTYTVTKNSSGAYTANFTFSGSSLSQTSFTVSSKNATTGTYSNGLTFTKQ